MLQAQKLLLETRLSITEAAASVGYGDVLAFSKFFSARRGISPRRYRNGSDGNNG